MLTPTETKILDILNRTHEPDEPVTAILAFLRSIDGKRLTKRYLPALRAIDPTCDLYHSPTGALYVSWGEYHSTGGRTGGSLLIHHYGTPASERVVNANAIEAQNPAYCAARIKRNHARMEARNDREALRRLASAVDAMNAARAVIESMTDIGATFDPVRHEVQTLAGMR